MRSDRPDVEPKRVGLILARVLVISAIAVGSASGVAACSSEDAQAIRSEATVSTEAPATTEAPAIEPTIELIFFDVEEEYDNMTFAANITNNADQAIVGLRTEWIAFDANDVIIGSLKSDQPTIPAGATFTYVSGSSFLDGKAAKVEITVVDSGKFNKDAPSPFLEVTDVTVSPDEFFGPTSYYVDAVVVAPPEGVDRDDVRATLIVRNAEGAITYAGVSRNLDGPDVFPAGSKFVIRFQLTFFEGSLDGLEVKSYIDESF